MQQVMWLEKNSHKNSKEILDINIKNTKGEEFHIFNKCYFEKWVFVCKMARLEGSFAQHYAFKMAKIGSLSCSINFHKLKHKW